MNSKIKVYSNLNLSNAKLTRNYTYLSNGWDDITSDKIKFRTLKNKLDHTSIVNVPKADIKKSKYNYKLFSNLLFKVFFTLFPLIVVGIILATDDFQFDFFYFLESFSKVQLNNTYDTIKRLSNNLKDYYNSINSIENLANNFIGNNWFSNVIQGVFNFFSYLVLSIKSAFTLPSLFISAIIDTLSNIIAFLTAFFKVFF